MAALSRHGEKSPAAVARARCSTAPSEVARELGLSAPGSDCLCARRDFSTMTRICHIRACCAGPPETARRKRDKSWSLSVTAAPARAQGRPKGARCSDFRRSHGRVLPAVRGATLGAASCTSDATYSSTDMAQQFLKETWGIELPDGAEVEESFSSESDFQGARRRVPHRGPRGCTERLLGHADVRHEADRRRPGAGPFHRLIIGRAVQRQGTGIADVPHGDGE